MKVLSTTQRAILEKQPTNYKCQIIAAMIDEVLLMHLQNRVDECTVEYMNEHPKTDPLVSYTNKPGADLMHAWETDFLHKIMIENGDDKVSSIRQIIRLFKENAGIEIDVQQAEYVWSYTGLNNENDPNYTTSGTDDWVWIDILTRWAV